VLTAAVATAGALVVTTRGGGSPPQDTAQFRPSHSLLAPVALRARPPRETIEAIRVGAVERSYLVVAPRTGTVGLPLLVDLAGSATTPAQELVRSGFEPLAATAQAVIAVPAALGPPGHQAWNAGGGCCQTAAQDGVNDVGFVLAMVRALERRLQVDPARIYVEGYSNGGKLAYTVVCDAPTVFAAVATYAATPQVACRDRSSPVSVFFGVGGRDSETPPDGAPQDAAGVHPPFAQVLGFWRKVDGCTATSQTVRVDPVVIRRYPACRGWATVSYATWTNYDHTWPRAPKLPPTATAATLMWQFLEHQVRAGGVS
jgi:polyhydroxybutyrate depolymerase